VVIVDSDGNVQGDVGDAGDGKDEQVFALAPGGNYYAVVVPNDTSAVGNGDTAVPYTLTVTAVAPECTATQACADNSKICDVEAGKCVACITDFDCKTSANPVCLTTDNVAACGKVDACTGDDAGESADDGPAGAVAVTVPTTTPVAAKICGEGDQPSEREADWYKFTLAAADDVTFTLDWTGAAVDLDIAVYDSTGEVVDSSVTKHPEVLALTALPAGDYFIQIVSYEGAPTAAIDYTLAITTP
ncbi:MAG: PPC domain-containing protein, partial [Myxococcota bacterium]